MLKTGHFHEGQHVAFCKKYVSNLIIFHEIDDVLNHPF
jgi:hypothetical protein